MQAHPQKLIKYVKSINIFVNFEKHEIIYKCLISQNCDLETFNIINNYAEFSGGYDYSKLPVSLNVKFDNVEDYKNYFKKFDNLVCSSNKPILKNINGIDTALGDTSLLYAIFAKTDSEILCYYINYFWFLFLYKDYAKLLQNTLSNAQIHQINNEYPELLVDCCILKQLINSKHINIKDVFNLDNLLKMAKVLCIKKDNFILLLNKVIEYCKEDTKEDTLLKLVIGICKSYKSKYSQIYMTNEFNDFIINFINSLKYEILIKYQKDLIEIIPNHDIWQMVIEKHINYSNMDSIINYLSISSNFDNIDIILNCEWDENSLQKLEKKIVYNLHKVILETLLKILKIGILKRYFNLIKDIIKRFMTNNNYDSLSEIYPILNEQYNTNIINIFVKFDYSFITKKHLTKKNYKRWNKSGKIKIYYNKQDDSESDESENESELGEEGTTTQNETTQNEIVGTFANMEKLIE
jgi:hypothetical protein